MSSSSYFSKMLTTEEFWKLQPLEAKPLPKEYEIKIGFVGYKELSSIFDGLEDRQRDKDEEMKLEMEVLQMPISKSNIENDKKSAVESRLLELYFVDKLKPKQISNKLRIGVERVYRVVEQSKKALIKLSETRQRKRSLKRRIKEDTKKLIEEYWHINRSRAFTIEDIRRHIKDSDPFCRPPSSTFISGYMKATIGLSYKKVSWRPLKVLSPEITCSRMNYISFVEKARVIGYRILQIDEFTVSRSTLPTREWTKKGVLGYVIQEQPPHKYSVIAAISEEALELWAISDTNTNGDVFIAFIEELDTRLSRRYGERKREFIMTCDGARYHSTNAVKNKVKDLKMTLVQTVPYSPEFSPVEIFINWIKSHIRRSMRKLK